MRRLLLLPAILAGIASGLQAQQLIACGWDEVFVLDLAGARKVWSWKAEERPEIPEAFRTKFRTTDECKPVAGNRILVTASSDGAALIDRESGRTLWWGHCANAHSAELLPGGRIAVACSVRETGGNRLVVFDAAIPEKELFSTELYSGHGAVWDADRQVLWALGGRDLRSYALGAWITDAPVLELRARHELPDPGGHDLIAVPGSRHLAVTTLHSVWLFDRDSGQFTPHPDLRDRHHVKAVAVHPSTGRLAFIQADQPNWWSGRIEFLHPRQTLPLAGERLYKIRWLP
ncbi:MAG: hypothetical protein IPM24_22880 [Bryobacterales bacterium]|jgi:hypothetical protein|nr:hypothetical protein [Bryobacterales bacterium]